MTSMRHEFVLGKPEEMSLEEWNDPKKWWNEDGGWFPLVELASARCTQDGAPLVQVKEKFGALRIYVNGGNEDLFRYLWLIEDISSRFCEVCGRRGKTRTDLSWHRTLCDEHYAPEQ